MEAQQGWKHATGYLIGLRCLLLSSPLRWGR